MKALLDTSVLVAAFLADHTDHGASLDVFLRFKKHEACCAAHTLAELYSTVTRLPGKHRVSAENAMLFLAQTRERLTLVTLNGAEYYGAIEEASAGGVTGSAIYDALLASCALKVKAEILYTWNVRHFQRFATLRRVESP